MKNTKHRASGFILSAVLAAVGLVGASSPANAVDECGATGYMTAAGDYASLYQPSGACYYAKLEATFYDANAPWVYYTRSGWARLSWPNWPYQGYVGPSSMYVGTTVPAYYEIFRYRGCTDTYSSSCVYSGYVTAFGNTPLP